MSGERVESIAIEWVTWMPNPADMKPGVLYVHEEYETAIHLCACGCGEQVVTPTLPGQWTLTIGVGDVPTLSPSIGNRFACRSHYYVRAGAIRWCGR